MKLVPFLLYHSPTNSLTNHLISAIVIVENIGAQSQKQDT